MTVRNLTPALVAIAALGIAACNQAGKAPEKPKAEQKPPVATVNGQPISSAAFAIWAQAQANKKAEELAPEQRKQALEGLVNLYVAAQEAEKQNVASDPEVAARLELERMNVLANSLFQQYVKGKTPTDQELKAEYDRQVGGMPKLEYHARHILVPTEELARDAIAKLGKGAKFEELAKKMSTDGSKTQGGELPWFAPGQMVKPFSDAVQKLSKGEYTKEPVKSEFGWHVIRLEDTRPVTPPPYETVKDRLGPMVQQRMVRDYIDGLRKTAKIEEKP
jgi:peptidyl-prolyl cis-trans isomerase C